MRIAVTGATGFVAANVVRHLVSDGHDVVAIDRQPPDALAAGHFGPAERWRFAAADVTDFDGLLTAAAGGLDVFVHMAALTPSAEEEAADPLRIIRVNAFGTATALEVARRIGVRRFVLTSSAAVYAAGPDTEPVREDAPLRTDRAYSITKQNGERLITYYAEKFGLETAATRICAVYGPMERPSGVRPAMSPIHVAVAAARRGETITIPTGTETLIRDWIHAADAAAGIASLVTGPPPARRAYNLGPGRGWTIAETLNAIGGAVSGARWTTSDDAATATLPLSLDPTTWRGPLDTSRLRDERGWSPRFGLAEGIAEYVRWLDAIGAAAG